MVCLMARAHFLLCKRLWRNCNGENCKSGETFGSMMLKIWLGKPKKQTYQRSINSHLTVFLSGSGCDTPLWALTMLLEACGKLATLQHMSDSQWLLYMFQYEPCGYKHSVGPTCLYAFMQDFIRIGPFQIRVPAQKLSRLQEVACTQKNWLESRDGTPELLFSTLGRFGSTHRFRRDVTKEAIGRSSRNKAGLVMGGMDGLTLAFTT